MVEKKIARRSPPAAPFRLKARIATCWSTKRLAAIARKRGSPARAMNRRANENGFRRSVNRCSLQPRLPGLDRSGTGEGDRGEGGDGDGDGEETSHGDSSTARREVLARRIRAGFSRNSRESSQEYHEQWMSLMRNRISSREMTVGCRFRRWRQPQYRSGAGRSGRGGFRQAPLHRCGESCRENRERRRLALRGRDTWQAGTRPLR